MGKLHETLAAEGTVTAAAQKLLGEAQVKFHKHTEFFSGYVRTLRRLKDTAEDRAAEEAAREEKQLVTTVPETVGYLFDHITKALDLKLQKHLTNQFAKADIVLDGTTVLSNVPVDFLLDLEKSIPTWIALFQNMPTLDPSKEWKVEREFVYRSAKDDVTTQTQKIMVPVVLAEATDRHPAQVKESTRDEVIGTFQVVRFSGAATSQQKADVLALLDRLLIAVKTARMRANSVDVVTHPTGAQAITKLVLEQLK